MPFLRLADVPLKSQVIKTTAEGFSSQKYLEKLEEAVLHINCLLNEIELTLAGL